MKRFFDILISSFLLIVLTPMFLVLVILILISLGYPAFFSQLRPGKSEQVFKLYKLRSMNSLCDSDGYLLPDSERITTLGRFLRSSSIDEIPSLWNVLKGEMSLVGPRPLLQKYLPFYTQAERVRHSVRPGITGWAQVNGRNTASWDDRLSMDVWYVNNQSLSLDLKIILLTVKKILIREGIVVDPRSIMQDLDVERTVKGSNN